MCWQLHAGQRWNLHKSKITLLLSQFILLLDSCLVVARHRNDIMLPRCIFTSDYIKEENSKERIRGRDNPAAKTQRYLGILLTVYDIYL